MKNYATNNESAKDFILKYIVFNNHLIINYANGSVEWIPYTIDNEKAILNKMKRQVLKSKRFLNNLNIKFEICVKLFVNMFLLFILFIISLFSATLPIWVICGSFIMFPTTMLITGYKLFSYQKVREDIKKHLLFLSNENDLNKIIRNNSKVIDGLDECLKEKILVREGNHFLFTINSIDNIEYRELRCIYDYANNDRTRVKIKTKSKNN